MFLGDNYRGFLCLKYNWKGGQNVGKCTKIIKNGPNRVEMAPFGPKLAQDRSHGLWEASGMPPGPPNRQKIQKKIKGFGVWGFGGAGHPRFALKGCGKNI